MPPEPQAAVAQREIHAEVLLREGSADVATHSFSSSRHSAKAMSPLNRDPSEDQIVVRQKQGQFMHRRGPVGVHTVE